MEIISHHLTYADRLMETGKMANTSVNPYPVKSHKGLLLTPQSIHLTFSLPVSKHEVFTN